MVPGLSGRAVLGGWLCAGALAQASAQGIFTCVDASGRRLTADRPIAECTDREQKILSSGGLVKGKIGPTLTAAERAAEEEKNRKLVEERNRQLEEKRRDRALLTRYPDRATHDKERQVAVNLVNDIMAAGVKRTAELATERKRLDADIEFYKADPVKMPPQLKRQIEENTNNMAAQKRFLATQESEKQRVNARFDEELGRLKLLWTHRSAAVGKP
ncbi:MAG TPA: DUF4124 domain-containing protein [Burkholderiaceae bacterium]|nr:DUF4124 domain-containing protein [Burkholderiaceae bacterium]